MANANDIIYVIFKGIKYKLVFTDHGNERITERGINIEDVKNSIEFFDINYQKHNKEIVEKEIKLNTMRTVFTIKTDHVILITSMILGK